MKKVKSFLISSCAVYACCLVVLYAAQRDFMYHPNTSESDLSVLKNVPHEVVSVKTEDDLVLKGLYLPATKPDASIIVFFHGNGGNIGNRFYKAVQLMQRGYGVLLAEYRGYGGNSGNPTEEGFYQDGRAYLEWLQETKGTSTNDMVVYGESIGTGVAVQMATEFDFQAIVLEAPYSSTVEVAENVYFIFPVRYLMKDRYESVQKIRDISAPILMMHGTRDLVIPITLAKKLFDAANHPKKFVEFPDAGHNNLYQFGATQTVLDFLDGT